MDVATFFEGNGWIDISTPLSPDTIVWQGDQPIQIRKKCDTNSGDMCTITNLGITSHAGTHLDAPRHFISNGKTLDNFDFDKTIGICRVIEITNHEFIDIDELKKSNIRPGERLLFRTENSRSYSNLHTFNPNFTYLSKEAAIYLAEQDVKTIGIDYLSIGGFFKDNKEAHLALLEANICIVENLDLRKVVPGKYFLICLPLKLVSADGAPARALLKPVSSY